MARDRSAEIQEIKARRPWSATYLTYEVDILRHAWEDGKGSLKIAPAYIPIRLVTLIEVCTKAWISELVDFGHPYVERAAIFVDRQNVKFDFKSAQGLVGKKFSLGEIVAHSQSISSLADLDKVFRALLDSDLSVELENQVDRYRIEVLRESPRPIINDMDRLRNVIHELFSKRHVLVHEVPSEFDLRSEFLSEAIESVDQFLRAMDERLTFLLRGIVPLTQTNMNIAAGEAAATAAAELDTLVARSLAEGIRKRHFKRAQKAWELFCHEHSEWISGRTNGDGGSIAPMAYYSTVEAIRKARIEQLQNYLDRPEGTLW